MADTGSNREQVVSDSDEISVFTETFASFNNTIKSLNESYAALQDRYQLLADELSATNETLRATLAENERTKSYLENVLESLTSGVLTIDLEGRITGINRAACQLLRVDHQAMIGAEYSRLFSGSFASRQPLTGLLNHDTPYCNVEKSIEVGEITIPISVSGSLITDTEGRAVGALEVFMDLTELKRMEDEIARVKSLAALGEVAAVVAHEVRNPLSGIAGFAMLLKRELRSDAANLEYVDKILAGVEKLDRCVSSLLDYAREVPLNPTTGDLREMLTEAVEFFRMNLAARKSNSTVTLDLPREPARCCFDSEHLSRALLNLMQNADQAMPEGGEISVDLIREGSRYLINVADQGESVPEEIKDKIFTPFFTTREGGTGLGLALVAKIVEAHQGTVELDTGNLTGSKFTMAIPDKI